MNCLKISANLECTKVRKFFETTSVFERLFLLKIAKIRNKSKNFLAEFLRFLPKNIKNELFFEKTDY